MIAEPPTPRPRLILASGSPRRRELLRTLDLRFEVRPAEIDETPLPDEDPHQHVARLAVAKARARAEPGELILAADTIVVVDGRILGKPSGPEEARSMLATIAGREHTVLTSVALWRPEPEVSALSVESTRVRMAAMSEAEIAWYVGTGEPLDKAGAYAIQDLGAMFVETIDGNYHNVVGLPVAVTYRLFGEIGLDLRSFSRRL